MAKFAPNGFYTNGLGYAAGANVMHICSSQPATYAAAVSASLADVAMSSGDFTEGTGDVSGRKLTVAAKNAVTVNASGDGTHIVLADSVGETLRYITTCTTQTLTAGNTMNFLTWDIEISAPA